MVKISPETIKEAAKSVNELMESASPELKMLLENPNFATGLCLVLHKEVQQLRQQLLQEASGEQAAPEQASQASKPNVPQRQAVSPPLSPQNARIAFHQAVASQPFPARAAEPAEPINQPGEPEPSPQEKQEQEELFV